MKVRYEILMRIQLAGILTSINLGAPLRAKGMNLGVEIAVGDQSLNISTHGRYKRVKLTEWLEQKVWGCWRNREKKLSGFVLACLEPAWPFTPPSPPIVLPILRYPSLKLSVFTSVFFLSPRIEPELVCLWLRMPHLSVSKGIIIPLGSSAFCEQWQVQGNFEIIYNDGSSSERGIIIHSWPGE